MLETLFKLCQRQTLSFSQVHEKALVLQMCCADMHGASVCVCARKNVQVSVPREWMAVRHMPEGE
jgi:hypothetical protein